MKIKEAKELVQEAIHIKSCVLDFPLKYQAHISSVSYNIYEVAKKLNKKGYEISPEEMEGVGYLHDIGRCFGSSYRHNVDFHEYVGARLLNVMGYSEEADIIKRHGFSFEKSELLTEKDLEGNVLNPFELLPTNLDAMLLCYIDDSVDSSGQKCRWEDRLNNCRGKYQKIDIENGITRLAKMYKNIEEMLK